MRVFLSKYPHPNIHLNLNEMKKQKFISSVEVHNNKEFIVWRKEDDTAIATLTNTLKGRYLVNEIRVLDLRNKTMNIITTFSDLYTAEMDAVC